jgi:hypothetical protein
MTTTPLFGLLSTCILDQNPPHRLSRSRKEVATAVPVLGFLDVHKPDVRLVHQRRRLQGLSRLLVDELGRSQFAKLVVHEGQQFHGRRRIAGFNLGQDLRGV